MARLFWLLIAIATLGACGEEGVGSTDAEKHAQVPMAQVAPPVPNSNGSLKLPADKLRDLQDVEEELSKELNKLDARRGAFNSRMQQSDRDPDELLAIIDNYQQFLSNEMDHIDNDFYTLGSGNEIEDNYTYYAKLGLEQRAFDTIDQLSDSRNLIENLGSENASADALQLEKDGRSVDLDTVIVFMNLRRAYYYAGYNDSDIDMRGRLKKGAKWKSHVGFNKSDRYCTFSDGMLIKPC